MKKIPVAAISVVLALASGAPASTLKIDSDHSAANFAIQHMAISKVKGSFSKVSGAIEFHETEANPFSRFST